MRVNFLVRLRRGPPPFLRGKGKHICRALLPAKSLVHSSDFFIAYQANRQVEFSQVQLPHDPFQERLEGPPRHAHRTLAVQNHVRWFSRFGSFPVSSAAAPALPLPAEAEFPPRWG